MLNCCMLSLSIAVVAHNSDVLSSILCWSYCKENIRPTWDTQLSSMRSFLWHVQNATIPCRSQELLPFAPVQTGPRAHPVSCTMGTGSFLVLKSGRGVTLTPHPLLGPWSWKGRAIPLLPLWAVRPVQSLSACTRVTFTFYLLSRYVLLWSEMLHLNQEHKISLSSKHRLLVISHDVLPQFIQHII